MPLGSLVTLLLSDVVIHIRAQNPVQKDYIVKLSGGIRTDAEFSRGKDKELIYNVVTGGGLQGTLSVPTHFIRSDQKFLLS